MTKAVPVLMILLTLAAPCPANFYSHQEKRQEQDQPPRLKADLIEARAVVTDRRGNFIRGLKKEDFEVLENGKPQQIGFLTAEQVEANETATKPSTRAPTDDVRLNRSVTPIKPTRTIVFFVDLLHLSSESVLRVKQMLSKFITERLRNDDLAAVIPSSGATGLFNQFTKDHGVMLRAVDRLTVSPGLRQSRFTPYLAALVQREDGEALRVAVKILAEEEGAAPMPGTQRMLEHEARLKARSVLSEASQWREVSLRTLDAVAERLAEMPGQRIIFYISDGFTLLDNVGNANGDLNRVTSRASRSGILIYSLAARGLEVDPLIGESSGSLILDPAFARYTRDSYKDLENGINALAKDTGGDAYFNTNDMPGALKKALDENSVYYAIAYYSSAERGDDKYRRLTVRVKDHPDYNVRSQKGYMPRDPKAEDEAAKRKPEERVMKAITAPLPVTDIGVSASAHYVLKENRSSAQVAIDLFVDGSTLEYHSQSGRPTVACEITTVIFDKTGKSTRVLTDKIYGPLTQDRIKLAKEVGFRYSTQLELKPGVYQARVGIRENGSERIGTANLWLEVPELKRTKLALSSILLNRFQPGDDKKQGRAGPELSLPGFRQGTPSFKQGTSLAYEFTVYQDGPSKPEESKLVSQSEVLFGEQSVYRSEWIPVAERLIGVGKAALDLGGRINLDLRPGPYELRITVKDPGSKRSAQQSAFFEVEK